MSVQVDTLVVGAGLSGLACARELAAAGAEVTVADKSRGIGGRCATRRIATAGGEVAVDHGLAFYHGEDPGFLAALAGVDATPLPGWPVRRRGEGSPCQPRALDPAQTRLAFAEGVNAFPKHLARGLAIERERRVVALSLATGVVEARTADGVALRARTVVLALPPEQARSLLAPLGGLSADLAAAVELTAMAALSPCLAVIAAYPDGTDAPEWDVWHPEDSGVLQVLVHDSAKRPAHRGGPVLVLQALPSWSRRVLEVDPSQAIEPMLAEAARLCGAWAATPAHAVAHRWRYARACTASEYTRPLLLDLPGGARVGITGEVFNPGGGAEAAWRAGRALGRRLCGEDGTAASEVR